jgi:phage tail sheath protein FI
MPVPLTYPGVYIEEIPSGVRTITGVATSITAFIGRAARGPVNEPTLLTSFGDFERTFGGLGVDYPMSYAVRDFYRNGGSTAVIVRLYRAPEASPAVTGNATVDAGGLALEAASPGEWGNNLTVAVDYNGIDDEIAERYGLEATDLFNLTVTEAGGATETHRNLSVVDGSRRVDRVLEQQSLLVRVQDDDSGNPQLPDERPEETATSPPTSPPTILRAEGGDDGSALEDIDYQGSPDDKTGLFALEKADLFNLLCIPPDSRNGDTSADVYSDAMTYCVERRAMLLVDSPAAWDQIPETAAAAARNGLGALGLTGTAARNAALYFPRVIEPDPLREGQLDYFVPCGIVAGIMARTDSQRGVWKAPAGLDAALNGVRALRVNLTDGEHGTLNPLGINCLRSFPVHGRVIWGARTLRGADQSADEYKYVPVRRLALFIEESLYRGTQWVVFEPNDEPLWAQIRLNVGAFMQNLFRQGAFQGRTPNEAYFVKVDKETTTQTDINLGIVNIVVGFAPLKPAEFVVIKIQQIAGEIET